MKASRIIGRTLVIFFAIASCALLAPRALAQSALSVSITPPLFQLTIGPGDSWMSSVKVVNNNTTPVSYYAQLADFDAKDETGNPTLIPLTASGESSRNTFSLASWITITSAPILVAPGSSAAIPFSIHVPENAEPGGHYGAILIGTEPLDTSSGTHIRISSFVSSLLFLRIKGDVIESGRILQFTSNKDLYETPEANFVLRFQNTGTTHVKPVGNIILYNMWGKERGRVDINQDNGNFGNVLPQSTRRFEFSWIGESNSFDIGEYSAVVTLAYGQDGKKNITATTYFWVVPIIPVAVTLLVTVLIIVLVAFFIRRYIRRALALERKRLDTQVPAASKDEPHITAQVLLEPIREGVIDLRAAAGRPAGRIESQKQVSKSLQLGSSPRSLFSKYKLFLLFVAVCIAIGLIISDYLDRALVRNRAFQIQDVHIAQEASSTP